MAVEDSLAYAIDFYWGLRIIDFADPFNPVQVGSLYIEAPYGLWDIIVDRGFAYISRPVLSTAQNIHIVDISDPTAPELVRSQSSPCPPIEMDIKDSIVICSGATPSSFLITSPGFITPVDYPAHSEMSYDVEIYDNYAFFGSDSDGIFIDSIDSDGYFYSRWQLPTELPCKQVEVVRGHLLAAMGDEPGHTPSDGIMVFDLSTPFPPDSVYFFQKDDIQHMSVYENRWVFCSCGTTGLWVLDAANPESIFVAGYYKPWPPWWSQVSYPKGELVFTGFDDFWVMSIGDFYFINEFETTFPEDFSISTYPNPFNSSVTISLDYGSESAKRLSTIEIFDVNGRMVAELIPPGPPLTRGEEERKSPLSKDRTVRRQDLGGLFIWHPDPSLGSGVYLVRARFAMLSDRDDGNIATKRVVYLK